MRSKSRENQRPSLDVLSPESVPARDSGAQRQSVIGPDLHIVGTIRSDGSVHIEGHVEGEVSSRALTVGPKAHVIGGVSAGIAEIHGTVEGDVTADTVVLSPTARLRGDIAQRNLSIEPGADFEGRILQTDAKASAEAESVRETETPDVSDTETAKSATG
jgi:cytoskeletal protein CcmA (bactofilin family)